MRSTCLAPSAQADWCDKSDLLGPLDRHTGALRVTIRSRRPLAPDTLKVALGDHWSSDAAVLPVETEVESVDDWSIAGINVPYHCGGVTLHAPPLDTWLPHQVAAPSPLEQARSAVSRLYARAAHDATSTGTARWERALLHARKGAHFEVALANALARLGIPLLFGGQVEWDVLVERSGRLERGEEVGGPATPGVDLVALDPLERRATAISAKANNNSPSDDEIQALLDGVAALQGELIGWTVFGVLACRAPRTRLGRFLARDDMRVWGREDLESIAAAESAVASATYCGGRPGLRSRTGGATS